MSKPFKDLVPWPESFDREQGCTHLERLSTLVTNSQTYIPSLSMNIMNTSDNIQAATTQYFGPLPNKSDEEFFTKFQLRIKKLHEVADLLCCLPDIQKSLSVCSHKHSSLPFGAPLSPVLHNLHCLWKHILQMKSNTESTLFHILDANPTQTTRDLKSVMKVSQKVKLRNVSPQNFETIGLRQWLDDEVINYFVNKWCSGSQTTLGLSTFFACRIIFQETSCINAKTGAFSEEDVKRVIKWCRAAQKVQGLTNWESVFIPINEHNLHWYSACINFRLKRIDIYDSLREVCLDNRRKPVHLRKNTSTMLVLMWLAEVIGSTIRGDDIQLRRDPATPWRCDPHTRVPFQPNSYDCGVHTLWHLKHILQFGEVQRDCELQDLKFFPDMIGKRLRLAQEILDDCGV